MKYSRTSIHVTHLLTGSTLRRCQLQNSGEVGYRKRPER